MRAHWQSGHRDTLRTLHHKGWLRTPVAAGGITVHDVQEDM
jgi:NTE family protein